MYAILAVYYAVMDSRKLSYNAVLRAVADVASLRILHEVYDHGDRSFSELRDSLHMSPTTLSDRLKKLHALKIVKKDVSKHPTRPLYGLGDYPGEVRRILKAYNRLADSIADTLIDR